MVHTLAFIKGLRLEPQVVVGLYLVGPHAIWGDLPNSYLNLLYMYHSEILIPISSPPSQSSKQIVGVVVCNKRRDIEKGLTDELRLRSSLS